MKILLDECVTKKLKRHLTECEVATVVELGWGGRKNGKLLTAAADSGFDILLTIDKNILYQQDVSRYDVAVVVFDTMRSKVDVLVKFLPTFKARIEDFQKGQLYVIENSDIESKLNN